MIYADQEIAKREIKNFLNNNEPFHILTGCAGSGKTYTLGEILPLCDMKVYFTATTHKAVNVVARAEMQAVIVN